MSESCESDQNPPQEADAMVYHADGAQELMNLMQKVEDAPDGREDGTRTSMDGTLMLHQRSSLEEKYADMPDEDSCVYYTRIVTLMVLALPLVGMFGVLFTDIGYGGSVYRKLAEATEARAIIAASFVGLLAVTYLTDMSHWTGKSRRVWYVLRVIFIIDMVCICVVLSKTTPSLPVACFLCFIPVYFYFIFRLCFQSVHVVHFLSSLSVATGTIGLLSMVFWVVWVFAFDRLWDTSLRERFKQEMACPKEPEYCLAAFLLWIGHFIASTVTCVFSYVMYFLASAFKPSASRRSHPAMKMFAVCLGIILFGAWIASMLAGSESQMSSLIYTFVFICGVGMFAVIGQLYGWADLIEEIQQNPNMQKLRNLLQATWVRGMLGLLFAVPFILYLGFSIVNKFVRKHIVKCAERPAAIADDKEGILTKRAYDQLALMAKWDRTAVLASICFWGIVFGSFQLGGKLVYLFLAWLGEQLESVPYEYTALIIFVVGFIMLLIPIVPGVPVYLLAGTVLVKNAAPNFGDPKTDGFWWAALFTCGVCMCIKFTAIVCQQKGIGEKMGGRTSIKSQVGINSPLMVAIGRILRRPGMNFGKIAILCGGPDWPTSVLTGILKLNLCEMLKGSIPVICLIAPTVLAGAFVLRAEEAGIWSSAYSMMMGLTIFVQGGAAAIAMYCVGQEQQMHAKTIVEHLKKHRDFEVDKLEKEDQHRQKLAQEASQWDLLPVVIRGILIAASIQMIISIGVFMGAGSSAFAAVTVSSKIDEPPLNGNVLNFMKPLGMVCAAMWVFALVLKIIFDQYIGCLTTKALAANPPPKTTADA